MFFYLAWRNGKKNSYLPNLAHRPVAKLGGVNHRYRRHFIKSYCDENCPNSQVAVPFSSSLVFTDEYMSLDPRWLEKPVCKIREFLKQTPRRPSIDQIHDLRTNSRHFDANIKALGLSTKRTERRLLRQLARVRKLAGKIRDVDVLTGSARSLHMEGEQDCLIQLLEILGASRANKCEQASRVDWQERS